MNNPAIEFLSTPPASPPSPDDAIEILFPHERPATPLPSTLTSLPLDCLNEIFAFAGPSVSLSFRLGVGPSNATLLDAEYHFERRMSTWLTSPHSNCIQLANVLASFPPAPFLDSHWDTLLAKASESRQDDEAIAPLHAQVIGIRARSILQHTAEQDAVASWKALLFCAQDLGQAARPVICKAIIGSLQYAPLDTSTLPFWTAAFEMLEDLKFHEGLYNLIQALEAHANSPVSYPLILTCLDRLASHPASKSKGSSFVSLVRLIARSSYPEEALVEATKQFCECLYTTRPVNYLTNAACITALGPLLSELSDDALAELWDQVLQLFHPLLRNYVSANSIQALVHTLWNRDLSKLTRPLWSKLIALHSVEAKRNPVSVTYLKDLSKAIFALISPDFTEKDRIKFLQISKLATKAAPPSWWFLKVSASLAEYSVDEKTLPIWHALIYQASKVGSSEHIFSDMANALSARKGFALLETEPTKTLFLNLCRRARDRAMFPSNHSTEPRTDHPADPTTSATCTIS